MLTHISIKTENTQHCYEKHWYNWYWQLRDPIFSLIIGLPFKRYTCFPMRWVKKTWSEITLKVFQTLTGVKNTWSAMENILLPKYSTPRAHKVFQYIDIDRSGVKWRTLLLPEPFNLMCGDILFWKFYSTTS